jgi:hypothetical protein
MSRIRHYNVKKLIEFLEIFDENIIHEQDLDDILEKSEAI